MTGEDVVNDADARKRVIALARRASSDDERVAACETARASSGEPAKLVKAVVSTASETNNAATVRRTAVTAAATTPDELKDVVTTALDSVASPDEKKNIAAAALDALSADQGQTLIGPSWPPGSSDRRGSTRRHSSLRPWWPSDWPRVAWGALDGTKSIWASLFGWPADS